MANMRKFADMRAIGHLCAHYERSVEAGHYGNEDIDQSRLHEDRVNLAPDRGKQTDYIKQQIAEVMDGRTLRKDAVRMCCWIVDAPVTLPPEREPEFFKATYDFLVNRYGGKSGLGEDCVISAYIHHSETTAHIHFAFLPVIERNEQRTFCAKEVVGRADLASFHHDLGRYLEARGICKERDILNGKTQRDASGRALSVREMKRNRQRDREREQQRTNDRWTRTDEPTRNRERGRW